MENQQEAAEPEDTTDVAWLQTRVAELENNWRTAMADLDNLRKRTVRDTLRVRQQERKRAAKELLTVLDNLDLAIGHAEADPITIVAGVEAVRAQADLAMADLGFPRYSDDQGMPFDPQLHEAVSVVPAVGVEPGTVVQVVRPGYGDAENQLRPAAVVVAKAD
ncbi:nucleotide exchange factor GrpE [Amycolatopsis sp. AA4]|uniref:nucleotide exchange factor GrpE n=1 Tax=Actinomycetes TaxID=1760 RepID=UPI0001B54B77|nr:MULTISPECIES: nucleotide exchange factor GrpE [Actinomycetes]ATY14004.1 nucleotide exchange factor GrpE [Amycolatopsis sp. AA4]EFL10032.1 co-chaperone GrpE [Streptomyces sp. AA4]